ncbi:DUF4301 family protein [bacterium]|nr:DUF4301 family protein [bacterium]
MEIQVTDRDRAQLGERGISEAEYRRQLSLLRRGPHYINLERPCTIGDGLRVLDISRSEEWETWWRAAAVSGRLSKFVPASGAATRMFQGLISLLQTRPTFRADDVSNEELDEDTTVFFERLTEFAFHQDLVEALKRGGYEYKAEYKRGNFHRLVEYILADHGLGYASKPKCLLKFHRAVPNGSRTSLEEHLLEAEELINDQRGCCRLHLTLSAEHVQSVREFLGQIVPEYESLSGLHYEVTDSVQHPSTDVIAADQTGIPLRDTEGRLVFRPGGHGALLKNLADVQADIVFIKNIDNVVPDRLRGETVRWKRLLCGYLLEIEARLKEYQRLFEAMPTDRAVLSSIAAFFVEDLGYDLGLERDPDDRGQLSDTIRSYLFRPLRVCGMVRNRNEPGGGPFWVRDERGRITPQIVESAQIDLSSDRQRSLFESATHFNPVDLVCSLRDYRGECYHLEDFIDPETYFLTTKFQNDRKIRVLEHPGLWNGGMANWLTVFVEVPLITFNPVKKVTDLLGPNHQA